jgi:predicted dehydrogenase
MTSPTEPRAAIIGAGLMGGWHADTVRRIGGRVTVIVDPNEKALQTLGRQHPGARLFGELDPALVAKHAGAAHVCSPLPTHEPAASALIDAGVHVLVEKPFAPDAASTASLLERAATAGVLACPVHQFVFQDGVHRIVESMETVGAIRRVEFSTCSAGAQGDDPTSLDALISEILPHPLALAQKVFGVPVAGGRWDVLHPLAGELRATAVVCHAILDISISAHGRPTENRIRVVGERGSVTADLFHGFGVRHDGRVSRLSKITQPFASSAATFTAAFANLVRRAVARENAYPGLRELIRQFYAATRAGRPSPISSEETLDTAIARDEILALL